MSIRKVMVYVKIAWRGVWRNRRRTTLTMAGVVFGTMSLVLFSGFVEGIFEQLREYVIHSRLGHIQITRPGYREFAALDPEKYSVDNFVELKKDLTAIPGVVEVTKRFEFFGLISDGQATVNFLGTGMEADIDARVNTGIKYIDGSPPRAGMDGGVSVGIGLARKLRLKLGDNVTLLTNYGRNPVNALDVVVVGIFESGVEAFDAVAVNVPMEITKTLLNVADSSAHLVVVMLDDTARTAQVAAAIDKLGIDKGWPLDVQTWDSLSTVYHKIVRLFSAILRFIRIVVILIVLFSITNTITMSVYERFREIGSIRAIGTTRAGVRWMFILEGAFIGLMGGVLGAVIANIPKVLLNSLHLTMPPPPILTVGVPLLIKFVPSAVIQAILVAVGLSVFASIFPARRAGKLSIVTALRSV